MTEHTEKPFETVNEPGPAVAREEQVAVEVPAVAEAAPAPEVPQEPVAAPESAAVADVAANGHADKPSRHVEAGRKGAHRVHELIQRGRLYEQEHGLTRGRQRLRQLLEEGKLYEQEHGLSPRRRKSRTRLSGEQALRR